MVAQLVATSHPVVACAQRASEAVAEAAAFEPVFMSVADKREALLAITELERRTTALKLRVMAASADLAEQDGARDVAAWLSSGTRAESAPLRIEQRLADALDKRWRRLGAALAEGAVSAEQALVIVDGLEALPARVGQDVLGRAEAQMVVHAQTHLPRELRILVRRILELVAPEIAEAEEARRLEEEEQRARDTCRLSFRVNGDGSTRISGVLPDDSVERLRTYLHAYSSPRKQETAISGEEDRIPYRRQLAQAFCSLLEHLDPKKLPEHGGHATSMIVIVPLDTLQRDLGATDDLSASAIRRLACTAKIIPAVLGGKGEILDLGRARRLFSPAQHRALHVRDKRCRADGCSIPARWTEAHHLKPWSEGGKTDLADGVLLCSYHHRRIHDRRFEHDVLASGDIRFHRRR